MEETSATTSTVETHAHTTTTDGVPADWPVPLVRLPDESRGQPMDVLFDMETNDPDDYLTLCLLAGHPMVNLRAVTIMPGTRQQVGVVRHTLRRLGLPHLKIGVKDPKHNKKAVSGFHNKALGVDVLPEDDADGLGQDVIYETIKQFPHCTVITGAPVTNVANAIRAHEDLVIERWVAQGGFAGDNIVPPALRMHKFDGKVFCPTFNFGGDSRAATELLNSPRVLKRLLVSKNVCHGVLYTQAFHERLAPHREGTKGLELIYDSMDIYLQGRGQKALHDPLAACVAIDPSIGLFARVEMQMSREKGHHGWGAMPSTTSDTYISVHVDKEAFEEVFRMSTNDGARRSHNKRPAALSSSSSPSSSSSSSTAAGAGAKARNKRITPGGQ